MCSEIWIETWTCMPCLMPPIVHTCTRMWPIQTLHSQALRGYEAKTFLTFCLTVTYFCFSLIARPLLFFVCLFMFIIHESRRVVKMGKTWEHLSHDIDAVPDYKFVGNKSEDEFLTVQVEYFCLLLEHLRVKTSMLFECGPLSPNTMIHLTSTWCYSLDKWPRFSSFLSLFCFCKPKTKYG